MGKLRRIFWLGLKEMMSLRRDWVMMALLVWSFTLSPVMEATGVATSVNNASIAFADEDDSPLSRTLAQAFFPPEFQPVVQIEPGTGAAQMDAGRFLFVVAVPPGFEKDVRAGRAPEIQVLIDATAMEQAGIGVHYITSILSTEIRRFAIGADLAEPQTLGIIIRSAFNPNRDTVRFAGINALIGQIMWLTTILTGAAMIREREHGTIEHLLAMPLSPFDIAVAKIWANAAVVLFAAALSLAELDDPAGADVLQDLVALAPYEEERESDPTRWAPQTISGSRQKVLRALADIGRLPADAELERLADEDDDPNVQALARELLSAGSNGPGGA